MHEHIDGNSLFQQRPSMELHLNSLDYKESSKYKIMGRDKGARNFFLFLKQFLLARSTLAKAIADLFIYSEVNIKYSSI